MRITTYVSLLGVAAALAASAGCVKDVDAPAFAGPSTFANSIVMVAQRNTLTQNGADFTDISITALGPDGQSLSIPLRAQIYVDGVPNDFGTLSTKTPITPTTIRYTAPPAPTLASTQVATTVTLVVTPTNSGDFRGEFSRQLDIQLLPQGIILPINPNLVANFTFTPASPQVGQTVAFDAATSTNGGTACLTQCTYSWNFGDGTSSTGLTTTKAFSTASTFPVTLTVTDPRGASSSKTTSVTVAAPTPPTGSFTVSPTPAPTNVDVFFNASAVQWAGRTITAYEWDFGDGTRGSGVTTTHRFFGVGTYSVILTVTDSSGTRMQLAPVALQVGGAGSNGQAALSITPSSPRVGQQVVFNASASVPSTGATIVNYRFSYGDGTVEDSSNPVQSHTYGAAGVTTVTLETRDSNGKTSTVTQTLTINP
ncbi:MAG TPA: PKD domain-containing protein [Vicinamibacterales bacterium]